MEKVIESMFEFSLHIQAQLSLTARFLIDKGLINEEEYVKCVSSKNVELLVEEFKKIEKEKNNGNN